MHDHPVTQQQLLVNRRHFFGKAATGIGAAALASLLDKSGLRAETPPSTGGHPALGLPDLPHFAPKAKNVVHLFQNGAPTHVELYDWKPKLAEMHGEPVPESYIGSKRFSTMTGMANGKLMLAPVEPFKQHGQSGATVSAFLPHIASIADDLCFVKSMHTDAVNHAPAISFFLSGAQIPGRPTVGAWLSYGLGAETDNLPAFVAMTSVSKGTTCGQIFYDFYWGSGFLADPLPGREIPRQRRSRAVSVESQRDVAHDAARTARRHRRTQPDEAGRLRGSRDFDEDLRSTRWLTACRRAYRS